MRESFVSNTSGHSTLHILHLLFHGYLAGLVDHERHPRVRLLQVHARGTVDLVEVVGQVHERVGPLQGDFLPGAAEIDEIDVDEIAGAADGHRLVLERVLRAHRHDLSQFRVLKPETAGGVSSARGETNC